MPAAHALLHQQGIRVHNSTLYRLRNDPHRTSTSTAEATKPMQPRQPDRVVYTPPAEVAALTGARKRAHAIGRDYRTRNGRLPTRHEVMTAAAVSEATAVRALRALKTEPPTSNPDQPANPRHRVRTDGQAARTEHRSRQADREHVAQAAAIDTYATTRRADVAVDRAERAVDELAERRDARQQRRAAEQSRTEQLNRWHADDDHDAHARTDAEGMCHA